MGSIPKYCPFTETGFHLFPKINSFKPTSLNKGRLSFNIKIIIKEIIRKDINAAIFKISANTLSYFFQNSIFPLLHKYKKWLNIYKNEPLLNHLLFYRNITTFTYRIHSFFREYIINKCFFLRSKFSIFDK